MILAGLLYMGSGVGLSLARVIRDRGIAKPAVERREWFWLAGAIGFGGVLGPVLLMSGLSRTSASDASLLLNLESVLTALLAWIVFRENADRRIIFGMVLIVAGGVALAWSNQQSGAVDTVGVLAIAGACLCWAIDNNLTRKVSASDALFIASTKGLVAGFINLAAGFLLGNALPAWSLAFEAMVIGLIGYGVSLVLFVVALRELGAARTGAYFATAPFIGAAIAILLLHEPMTIAFCVSAALMAVGVWLHLTERHDHEHTHERMRHTNRHWHDLHHQHPHDAAWDGNEPHTHEHEHEPTKHTHAHYPDVHHQHRHG